MTTNLLRLRPWWRGPGLLLRRPGVALALVAAAFVAVLPAAAAPLFLSSARSATLHHRIDSDCPYYVGARISTRLDFPVAQPGQPAPTPGSVVFGTRTRVAAEAAARVPGLGPGVTTVWSTAATPLPHDAGDFPVRLVARTGFAQHVQVVTGPDGDGAWIPDSLVELTGLRVGDQLRLSGSRTGTTAIRIAAVYRDLRRRPDTTYWCSTSQLYRGFPGEGNFTPIPVMALMSSAQVVAALPALTLSGNQIMEYPIANARLTQPAAAAMGRAAETMRTSMFQSDPPVFNPAYYPQTHFTSNIGGFAARAQLVRDSLLPPVLPITAAGVLVGLLVVAAATVFWVQRRRVELRVLAAHGVGPAGLGLKAVTEALPALLVGAVAGWLAAYLLVRTVGPSPVLSAEAGPLALVASGGTLAVATALTGLVAAVRCRGLADQVRPHRRIRLAALPWELLLLAAAVPGWLSLDASTEQTAAPQAGLGSVARVPGRLLIVPIMVVAGVAVLAARLGTRWLRSRGTRRTPTAAARFLAWRRIGREAAVAATLAAATAVPIALAAYGGTVTGSVRATLMAEARVRVGTDVVLTLSKPAPVPRALRAHATEVLRLGGAEVGGVRTDVLAIDPQTFTRGAFWDGRIDGRSLDALVDLVGPAVGGAPVPVVASGVAPAGDHVVNWGGDPVATVHTQIVRKLPAEQGGYPVMLIRGDMIGADAAKYATPQLWVSGDPDEILHAAAAANLPLANVTTARDLYAATLFEPLTYTFDYLTALSLLTGVIATVGLLLYLEGRAPVHRRGYAMLRRMGMRRRTHRRALLVELAVPLFAGLAGGLALAGALAAALNRQFEIDPRTPPDTVLTVPYPTLAGTVLAVAVIGLGAAWYAERRVARANPSEVLRDTV